MIRNKLTSYKISERIITLTCIAFILFFGVTILSYFMLPEGFLLNKNNITNFNTSSNIIVCMFQIFLWNLLSVVAIFISCFFAKKRKEDEDYISLSYSIYFIMISLAGVTLGTWSFTSNTISVPIFQRIIDMFNIVKHAGLIELYGQLLITCALSNKYLVMTYKKKTTTKNIKDVKWTRSEVICLIVGILLMLIGAFIESNAMLN